MALLQRESLSTELPRYKAVLVGEAGVGKTSLWLRYKTGRAVQRTGSTIGIDYCQNRIKVLGNGGTEQFVEIQLWDTGGGERSSGSLTRNYYRDAHAIFFVFSVEDKSYLSDMEQWLSEVRNYAHNNPLHIFLCNKMDLPDDDKKICTSDILNFFNTQSHVYPQLAGNVMQRLFFVSAKDQNDSLFDSAIETIAQILHGGLGSVPGLSAEGEGSVCLHNEQETGRDDGKGSGCPC